MGHSRDLCTQLLGEHLPFLRSDLTGIVVFLGGLELRFQLQELLDMHLGVLPYKML
jgi:hypothetical protein